MNPYPGPLLLRVPLLTLPVCDDQLLRGRIFSLPRGRSCIMKALYHRPGYKNTSCRFVMPYNPANAQGSWYNQVRMHQGQSSREKDRHSPFFVRPSFSQPPSFLSGVNAALLRYEGTICLIYICVTNFSRELPGSLKPPPSGFQGRLLSSIMAVIIYCKS